jgi:glycosyltransferase involved in cell wall biosynthesis
MNVFSIIIIAKDAGDKINRLLQSVANLSGDIVVCDTGSSDNTISVAESYGARVYSIPWLGYGKSKNEAIQFAKYNWILSLDSDEKIDPVLYKTLENWLPKKDTIVYQVKRKNFLGNTWIVHSDWGGDWQNRLFNKNIVCWDDAIAHEVIIAAVPLEKIRLTGYLEHYTYTDKEEYKSKMIHYANLMALKYYQHKKKSNFLFMWLSPLYNFIKTYFFKLGFMDGKNGWMIAKTKAYYTFIKYRKLKELNNHSNS